MNILYSARKHSKLQLGNLDSGLQTKEKNIKWGNGLLEKSCKDVQTTTI